MKDIGTVPGSFYKAKEILEEYTGDDFIRGIYCETLPLGLATSYGMRMYELGQSDALKMAATEAAAD